MGGVEVARAGRSGAWEGRDFRVIFESVRKSVRIAAQTDTFSALFKKVFEKVCETGAKQTLFQH